MDLTPSELQVRWRWRDQVLAVHQLADGALRVGPGTRCDVLPEMRRAFELARREPEGWRVHVPAGAAATLDDGHEVQSLGHRRLSSELALGDRERAVLDFGAVQAELSLTASPARARASFTQGLDWRFLYFLVATAFVFGLLAVSGSLASGDRDDDELTLLKNLPVETHVWIRPPPPPTPSTAAASASERPKPAPKTVSRDTKPAKGKDGRGRPDAAQQVRSLFGGAELSKLIAPGDLGASLAAAVAGIGPGTAGVAGGIEGLVLRGGPPGGGPPGKTIGIGGLPTKHGPGYGTIDGLCQGASCKESVGPDIAHDEIVMTGGLDKDLIRQVIHRNRAQLRYCYEESLVSAPTLAGRVEVHFVIGAEGNVLKSEVASSSTHTPALDSCVATRFKSWLFPKPKGGGMVDVSYPVVLQRTGSM